MLLAGSRVKGTAWPGSDVDLLVIMEELKYGDRRGLDVFKEGERHWESREAAELVEEHSPKRIAQQLIEPFESLERER